MCRENRAVVHDGEVLLEDGVVEIAGNQLVAEQARVVAEEHREQPDRGVADAVHVKPARGLECRVRGRVRVKG